MRRLAHWRDVTRLDTRMAMTAPVAGAAFLFSAEEWRPFRAAMKRMLPVCDRFFTGPVQNNPAHRIQAVE